jgi:glutamyl-tRNA synthetase
MPLLRNTDKSKISKRKNPAARLTWFAEQGYLPEALVNFLALLAYPPIIESDADGNTVEREVFSFEEFSERFDWAKVNPVGPIFDLKKLGWLNGVYIRALDRADFVGRMIPFLMGDNVFGRDGAAPTDEQLTTLTALADLIQTRMALLTEASGYVRPFFVSATDLPIADDARAQLKDGADAILGAATAALADLDGGTDWTDERIEAAVRAAVIDGMGLKPKVGFTPIRVAISGARISPPLFESMRILGKDETLARLDGLTQSLVSS